MAELMKGKVWSERKHKMTYPCFAEVKHDEIRCHIKVRPAMLDVEFLSYAGKPLQNMQEFRELWLRVGEATGMYEFDCGFEVNGNFNDSYRWVRSSTGAPSELLRTPKKFFVFDLPELTGMQFEMRNRVRAEVTSTANGAAMSLSCDTSVHVPDGYLCCTEEDVERVFIGVRGAGFEGLMVKSLEHTYQRGKRIDGWLKMKPEDDADGIIVDIHEAISDTDDPAKGLYKGKPLGRANSVTVRLEDGSHATPHGIPHELGKELLANPSKYMHKQWCEFSYMERDRQGGYRHPVFRRLREAK